MYWKDDDNIIWVEKSKLNFDETGCPVCGKPVWVECERNKEICASCGFTKSKNKGKLIQDGFGYTIQCEK